MTKPTLPPQASAQETSSRSLALLGSLVFLALTAAIALAWSHARLLDQDEMFVLQTDSVSSVAQLVRVQLHFPISLDPLTYHLFAHGLTRLFGVSAFALRLPSLLGYLLMQLCLFLFVRRAVGGRTGTYAGLVALALPALPATLFYAQQARPYGLMLGLYGLVLVSWQAAAQRFDPDTLQSSTHPLRWPLPVLAIALALELNAHYFGILLLAPLYAAELTRILTRRRIDWPMIAALALGSAGIVFALPFQKAAARFRLHYYNAGKVNLHAVTQAYRSLFIDYTHMSLRTQHFLAALFVLVALLFLGTLALHWRTFALPSAEAVFLVVLSALPFFGFILAVFVTHSVEVRYVLGAIIGITALAAILLAPLLRRSSIANAILALLFLLSLAAGIVRVREAARTSRATLASLVLPPAAKADLLSHPSERLYFQEMGHYEIAQYYQPDPAVRARITLVYSAAREIRFDGHDTEALTAEHMLHFTQLNLVPYDQLASQPSPHLFALYHSGWDWTDQAFAEDHASVQPLSPWFDGTLAWVSFPTTASH